VPLIAVASKCIRQENDIDESNVSKEAMKDEYNETIADVDDGIFCHVRRNQHHNIYFFLFVIRGQ
jgi:hypothetical protein